MRSRLVSPLAFLVVATQAPVFAQAPPRAAAVAAAPSPVLAYQGQYLEGGTEAITGSRTFQFDILGSSGAALWSSGPLTVAVKAGLYAVELGVGATPAIPQAVPGQTGLKLRVAVGTELWNLVVMSPDVDLIPVFQASSAFQMTGAFAGDMGGTQNATTLLRLQGYPLDLTSTAPKAGQVLAFTGSRWVAGTVAGQQGPAGSVGPQGPMGASGPTGPQGPAGPAGAPGATGPMGHTLWSGTGVPASTLGAAGDFYLDTAVTQLYGPRDDIAWPATGVSLLGPQGPVGAKGAAGATGPIGVTRIPGAQGLAGPQGLEGTSGPAGAQGPTGATGPQGASGAPVNYQQIAMLKYSTPTTGASFSAGNLPEALAFDGATIWSASYDGWVYGVNALTGAGVASYNLGKPCIGIVSDGIYNWVITTSDLVKMKVADGTIVWRYGNGMPPGSIAYDGTNIWVGIPTEGAWYLTPASAATAPTAATAALIFGPGIQSMATIGTSMMAGTNAGVQMFNLAGQPGSYLHIGGNHYGMAFDGASVWVANSGASGAGGLMKF